LPTKSLAQVAVEEGTDELIDHEIYLRLAKSPMEKNPKFRETYQHLADIEYKHYELWKKYAPDAEFKLNRLTIYFVLLLRRVLGASFAIKYLERREHATIAKYKALESMIPMEDKAAFEEMIHDEEEHEIAFAEAVQGGYVKYMSFIILGLADALVEISGIHAGSLGIYNSTELTGLAGIVAGAAASIAMASAAYAQAKQGFQGSASISAAYTGISYFISAVILASPYFLTRSNIYAIAASLFLAVIIIAVTSYYEAVISVKGFRRDFLELTGIMFGATLALYVFGYAVRILTGITI
jgi:VIT1/CCC1 family predicted Fe2+/Mn2+ transporter